MGFFSSIGKFVKNTVGKVVDTGKNLLGGVVDAVTDDPIGAVGTAGKVVGGLLGNSSQADANAANIALAREQLEWQKEYTKNRLQWQVEDAKKAGLHPMVAAGLSPVSFSPVSAQQSPIDYDWVGEAGQSLSYASAKAKDREQQRQAWQFQQELAQEQITGVRLDNELKVMQILSDLARLNQTGPAAPSLDPKTLIGGQNDSPSSSSLTSGVSPLMGASRVGNSLFLHLNPDIADSITEDFVRNMVANIAAEGSIPRMYADIARRFSKEEQEALKRGDAELRYVGPSQIQFLWRPHMRPKYSSDKKSVSGRLIF